MWKYLLFLPQYGHALSLIIERRIIQLDMLVTSKKRKLTLQRDEGALIWIASEDRFFFIKSPNLQNHLHFVHTVIYRNHKCKKIPSFSKRGIKVQKHALSMVSMPCPGGSQTTFKTFVCEMSHKVGLPWVLLKHKLE